MEPDPAITAPAATVETHSAVVFFYGDRVYKVKKPVDLGFLDFTTVEARRQACHDEVRLNARLSPDVYLGVADVMGSDGVVCDHLVVMKRMPDDRRLSTLVVAGTDVTGALRSVARQVAALHARSPRTAEADVAAGVDATRARWAENTNAMADLAREGFLDEAVVDEVDRLATRYLDGRTALFEDRVAAGRAVDGHGDLMTDDIFLLPDGPRVLDCLDFAERFRLGDGLSDAAFLAMDLERLGRPDLATVFLDAYREHGDDVWPPSLAHHHVAYRAQVRAKVEAIRGQQGNAAALLTARDGLRLAHRHLDSGRVRLVMVGGLPGTGKSTLATAVAAHLDAVLLRSDEVRKELAGVESTTPMGADYGEGLYAEETRLSTYDVLLDRARIALGLGQSVVVDASWNDEALRERARTTGIDAVADLTEFQCTVPAEVAAARIAERAARGHDASDATPDIARAMAARWHHWPTATRIDTAGDTVASRDAALQALDTTVL